MLDEMLPTISPKFRKSISQLHPATSMRRRRAYVLDALNAVESVDDVKRAVMHLLSEKCIRLPEEKVLESIERFGLESVKLLDGWWTSLPRL